MTRAKKIVLVDLGRADSFKVADKKARRVAVHKLLASENWRLLSDTNGRTLYICKAKRKKEVGKTDTTRQTAAAKALYGTWSDFEPDGAYTLPELPQTWNQIGSAKEIQYTSDKWEADRKNTGYVHTFEHITKVFAGAQQKNVVYKLAGGFAVKAAGITG